MEQITQDHLANLDRKIGRLEKIIADSKVPWTEEMKAKISEVFVSSDKSPEEAALLLAKYEAEDKADYVEQMPEMLMRLDGLIRERDLIRSKNLG